MCTLWYQHKIWHSGRWWPEVENPIRPQPKCALRSLKMITSSKNESWIFFSLNCEMISYNPITSCYFCHIMHCRSLQNKDTFNDVEMNVRLTWGKMFLKFWHLYPAVSPLIKIIRNILPRVSKCPNPHFENNL